MGINNKTHKGGRQGGGMCPHGHVACDIGDIKPFSICHFLAKNHVLSSKSVIFYTFLFDKV